MARILLIEDDALTLQLVAAILEVWGHDVRVEQDGAAGIAAATTDDRIDLVVTDMNLRGVDGWEVVRRIRSEKSGEVLPVLALSAFTTSQDRDEAFKAGCNGYETKPVDGKRLVKRVNDLLG